MSRVRVERRPLEKRAEAVTADRPSIELGRPRVKKLGPTAADVRRILAGGPIRFPEVLR